MSVPNLLQMARQNAALSDTYRAEAVADAVHALHELVRDGSAQARLTIEEIPRAEFDELDAETRGHSAGGCDRKIDRDPAGLLIVEYIAAEEPAAPRYGPLRPAAGRGTA